ncbi:hypothetical protein LCGC14_0605500 [marine sediment metagenome]|uniref:Phage virion morphogenesis protein n=2 Tax=root TaxID=1 RepID=A0A9C9NJU4_9HYPH|nr:hypothetical protein [Aurantimonas coralicida]
MPAEIEIDLRGLDKAMKRALKAGTDLRPAFRKLRTPLRKDQKDHMRAQSGPGGKWPGLSTATVEKRLKMGGRRGALTKKGKRRKSSKRKLNFMLSSSFLKGIKTRIFPTLIGIRAIGDVAALHQGGGKVGGGVTVPQREFLWISDPLFARALRTFAKHLASAFEGKRL